MKDWLVQKGASWGVSGWIPANVVYQLVPKPYAEVISTEELSAVLSTARETLTSTEVESLVHAGQAARSGAPESLLGQAGTIARLLQIEVRRYPILSGKLLHTFLLNGPQTKSYAEVISTEKLSVALATVAETLSSTEMESLVRVAITKATK